MQSHAFSLRVLLKRHNHDTESNTMYLGVHLALNYRTAHGLITLTTSIRQRIHHGRVPSSKHVNQLWMDYSLQEYSAVWNLYIAQSSRWHIVTRCEEPIPLHKSHFLYAWTCDWNTSISIAIYLYSLYRSFVGDRVIIAISFVSIVLALTLAKSFIRYSGLFSLWTKI